MNNTNTHHPLISVITPAYNAARFLPDLLESVAKQDYPFIEHIVIDDGSDDDGDTLEILKSWPGLIWWSRPNRGQYATINEGIKNSSGDYVIIISADDMFVTPSTFSDAMECYMCNRSIDLIYGRTITVDINGLPIQNMVKRILPMPPWMSKYYGFASHCSVFVSRELLISKSICWNETYRYTGDWEWLARIFQSASLCHFVDKPFSLYRVHSNQISSEEGNRIARKRETDLISKQIGGNRTITQLIKFVLNVRSGIIKRLYRLHLFKHT